MASHNSTMRLLKVSQGLSFTLLTTIAIFTAFVTVLIGFTWWTHSFDLNENLCAGVGGLVAMLVLKLVPSAMLRVLSLHSLMPKWSVNTFMVSYSISVFAAGLFVLVGILGNPEEVNRILHEPMFQPVLFWMLPYATAFCFPFTAPIVWCASVLRKPFYTSAR